ncbi:MAG: hypothetical protein ACTHOF_16160 [Flavisolibacter sp.]
MDLFDTAFIGLWQSLNKCGVRYILVGSFATNFHGFQRYTGDVDLYIDDTRENRKRFRQAYADLEWVIMSLLKQCNLFPL